MSWTNPIIPMDNVCKHFLGKFRPGETKSILCDKPLLGSHAYIVRLTPDDNGTLSFCEIGAFRAEGRVFHICWKPEVDTFPISPSYWYTYRILIASLITVCIFVTCIMYVVLYCH